MQSLGFSSFRKLMDIWDENLKKEDLEKYILFFKFNKDIYAGDENARISYAEMKENNKDLFFIAKNIKTEQERNFDLNDIKNIKIISLEKAKKEL